MTKVKRVLLVRHGQTDWNVDGRWQGSLPIALNAEGFAQAQLLANHLRHQPIGSIVTSDLPRALQTAATIGETLGLQPQIDPRWQEFNLGIFQGHTREQMMAKFPREWDAFNRDYWDYRIPHGESRRNFQARLYAAWQHMLDTANTPEVIAVSHGGAIKMLLLKLFPDVSELHNQRFENTSITTLEREGDKWNLVDVGSIVHLSLNTAGDFGEATTL